MQAEKKISGEDKQKDGREDSGLRNRLKAVRTRMGLSQQELAQAAGIARQTVGGIEAELYAPSAQVALKLAKTLQCRVEDLFWLEEDLPVVEAVAGAAMLPEQNVRVTLARIGTQWVAYPLLGDAAFRAEMVPADGVGRMDADGRTVRVRGLDVLENLTRSVVIAGCAPALSLWARSAERWHPDLRVHWTYANSTDALHALAGGRAHAAGVHLSDSAGGVDNAPHVRRMLAGRAVVLVNIGLWEEGLLVAPGNPLRLKNVADLAQIGVRIVNREQGAGARLLLDTRMQAENVPSSALSGYDRIVLTHQDIARMVQSGQADAGLSAGGVAGLYGLDFVPLKAVRYDLAILKESLPTPPVQMLLETLGSRWIQSQLRAMGGYDVSRIGEVIEV